MWVGLRIWEDAVFPYPETTIFTKPAFVLCLLKMGK
jgi:hypothetical protein